MRTCHILIFESTHQVMKAEKLLLADGFKLEIISTPREITAECGVAIRMKTETTDINKVRIALSENNIKFTIYEKTYDETL